MTSAAEKREQALLAWCERADYTSEDRDAPHIEAFFGGYDAALDSEIRPDGDEREQPPSGQQGATSAAATGDATPSGVAPTSLAANVHEELLDLAKTQMQETGVCAMGRLTLAEAVEIADGLGIDSRTVSLSGHYAQVVMSIKRYSQEDDAK